MKITHEFYNPLFKRKEMIIVIEKEISPNKTSFAESLAEKLSTKQENIKISRILSHFGSKTFQIHANVYESKDDLDKVELKSKKQRDAEKKVIAEATKVETKPEEKKE